MPDEKTPLKILIVPHQPHRNLKVRAIEMARHLACTAEHQVYLLTWQLSSPSSGFLPAKALKKAAEMAQTSSTAESVIPEGGVNWVQLPYLLAPHPYCQRFNRQQLKRFTQKHGIEIIISANAYHFPMPDLPGLHRIYDVVDDHLSPGSGPNWQKTRAFTLTELEKADCILTISHALQAELRQLGFAHTQLIPNGVDLNAFRQVSATQNEAIRQRYDLAADDFVVGYIGNHGWWSGMALLMESFGRFHAQNPKSRLLIVGPGEELEAYRQQPHPGVIFTGPVPPAEIAAYFKTIDLGVLPFQICPFTDNALPLKILEYGAAQKPVLATPLRELKTLRFPHVRLLDPQPEVWAAALGQAMAQPTPWQGQWDDKIAAYAWPRVLAPLDEWLGSHHAPAV